MDTKLKDKLSSAIRLFLLLAGVFVGFYLLYFIVDFLWNGAFADWFFNNFISVDTIVDSMGQAAQVTSVLWYRLKAFIRDSLLAALLLGVLLILFIARRYARTQVRKALSQASRMIRLYMEHDLDAAEVFPGNYAELSTQMVQL